MTNGLFGGCFGYFNMSHLLKSHPLPLFSFQLYTRSCFKYISVLLFGYLDILSVQFLCRCPVGAFINSDCRPYFRASARGIGYSFQLAITTPRINLIGYGTATAQSWHCEKCRWFCLTITNLSQCTKSLYTSHKRTSGVNNRWSHMG